MGRPASGKWRAEPRSEPDSGHPTVRDRRGALGDVTHGEPRNPIRNRKSGLGHSSPTGARAQDLSRQPARPDLWGAGVGNDPGLPDQPEGIAVLPHPVALLEHRLAHGSRKPTGNEPERLARGMRVDRLDAVNHVLWCVSGFGLQRADWGNRRSMAEPSVIIGQRRAAASACARLPPHRTLRRAHRELRPNRLRPIR